MVVILPPSFDSYVLRHAAQPLASLLTEQICPSPPLNRDASSVFVAFVLNHTQADRNCVLPGVCMTSSVMMWLGLSEMLIRYNFRRMDHSLRPNDSVETKRTQTPKHFNDRHRQSTTHVTSLLPVRTKES